MRVPEALQSAGGMRRWLTAVFTERLGYKAAALFFAIVLWFIVSAEEPAEDWVAVRFAPALDRSLDMVSAPPAIRARVTGRGRELLKLYAAEPIVRRSFGADVPDTVRVELRPSDVDVPAGVVAVVRELRPRAFHVVFRRVPEVQPDSASAPEAPAADTQPATARAAAASPPAP